jgi:hypothetical protein
MNIADAKKNTVYTFKLNSGEELIAKVLDTDNDNFIIEHPVSCAPGPQGMGLIPSMFTNDPQLSVALNSSSVSLFAETETSIRDKYREATTGITVPEKSIVLG